MDALTIHAPDCYLKAMKNALQGAVAKGFSTRFDNDPFYEGAEVTLTLFDAYNETGDSILCDDYLRFVNDLFPVFMVECFCLTIYVSGGWPYKLAKFTFDTYGYQPEYETRY